MISGRADPNRTKPKHQPEPMRTAAEWEEMNHRRREDEQRAAQRRDERERDARLAELALPAPVRELRQKIAEVAAIIASKEQSLYYDTLNERAHDRLYESVQRDRESLERLHESLVHLEQQSI